MDQKTFENVKNLHLNWYVYAVKALIAQMAKHLYTKINSDERHRLTVCLYNIPNDNDLKDGAKCLVDIRKRAEVMRSQANKEQTEGTTSWKNQEKASFIIDSADNSFISPSRTKITQTFLKHIQDLRIQINKKLPQDHGIIAKKLTIQAKGQRRSKFWLKYNTEKLKMLQLYQLPQKMYRVKTFKQKNEVKLHKHQNECQSSKKKISIHYNLASLSKRKLLTIHRRRIHYQPFRNTNPIKSAQIRRRRSPYRLILNGTQSKIRYEIKQLESIKSLITKNQKSPIQRAMELTRIMVNGGQDIRKNTWMKSYKKLLDLKKIMDEKSKSPGAKIYNMRLYDIVLNRKYPTRSSEQKRKMPKYLAEVLHLIDIFKSNKMNVSTIKLLSPRIAPLVPESGPTESRLFSPSFLSFYKDDSLDNIAALPKILDDNGISEDDRSSIIEMVMDISGAKDAIEASLKILSSISYARFDNEINEVTFRLDKAFEHLAESLNNEQKNKLDSDGFAFLEVDQIKQIMSAQGIKDMKDLNFDIDAYEQLSKRERYHLLWKSIEEIANRKATKQRKKRDSTVLQPTILAPYMFAPIIGLTILGPTILSPNIFSPLVLNPAVLSPYILSAALFMPFIVSPYVLSPYILTPIIGAPFILSPYVISPNVINPYVMSPLILSPYVLCPDVLSPQTLGGQILSPNVLSPSFLSDSLLMAKVLSPTYLS